MNAQPQPAQAPEKINARDVITLTARLAQVLAAEVDALSAMKIKDIAALHQEKQFLVSALETHRRILMKHPHLAETIPSHDKQDLQGVIRVFEDILQENHRRLLAAREVNRKIVQTIAEVVKEKSMSCVYNGYGNAGALGMDALSVTLNQTA